MKLQKNVADQCSKTVQLQQKNCCNNIAGAKSYVIFFAHILSYHHSKKNKCMQKYAGGMCNSVDMLNDDLSKTEQCF